MVKRNSLVVLPELTMAAKPIPLARRCGVDLLHVLYGIKGEPEFSIIDAIDNLERLGHVDVHYVDPNHNSP